MLSTRTLEDMSVEALADEAGISHGLLFHYFRSKRDFAMEVAREMARRMLDRTAPDPGLDPLARLRATIAGYVDYVSENPQAYVSVMRGAASGDAALRELFDETRAVMVARLQEGIAGLGMPLSAPVSLTLHGWLAFCEETTIQWIRTGAFGRDELLDLLTAALPALVAVAGTTQEGANES